MRGRGGESGIERERGKEMEGQEEGEEIILLPLVIIIITLTVLASIFHNLCHNL